MKANHVSIGIACFFSVRILSSWPNLIGLPKQCYLRISLCWFAPLIIPSLRKCQTKLFAGLIPVIDGNRARNNDGGVIRAIYVIIICQEIISLLPFSLRRAVQQ